MIFWLSQLGGREHLAEADEGCVYGEDEARALLDRMRGRR